MCVFHSLHLFCCWLCGCVWTSLVSQMLRLLTSLSGAPPYLCPHMLHNTTPSTHIPATGSRQLLTVWAAAMKWSRFLPFLPQSSHLKPCPLVLTMLVVGEMLETVKISWCLIVDRCVSRGVHKVSSMSHFCFSSSFIGCYVRGVAVSLLSLQIELGFGEFTGGATCNQ